MTNYANKRIAVQSGKITAFKQQLKEEKGITLVALVITIIIIIILSMITINMAFGDNGLIKQAELARNMATNSTTSESEDMNSLISEYANLIAKNSGIIQPGGDTKPGGSTGASGGTTTEDGVPIPDGFYYVGGTKEEGVVISDAQADAGKGTSHEVAKSLVGNQFVWIPVEDDSKFKTYEGYYNGKLDSMLSDCSEPYASGYYAEQSEYDAMKDGVIRNKGFYVGRYEAGTTRERSYGDEITDPVLVQQGKNVYNYVMWGNAMNDEAGGAVELSKNFDTANGYTSVTSTLIYGVQWDAIMNFIDPAYATGTCAEDSFVRDSSGKGWYGQNTQTTTGSNANYAVKNIYDLGGNVREWTMEAYLTNIRVSRGSSFSYYGSNQPASLRDNYLHPSNSYDYLGFRLALYIK